MFSISRIFVVRMKRYKEISLSLSSLRISYFEIIFVRNKDKKLWHGKMFERKVRRKFESKSYVSNKCRYSYVFKNLRPSEKMERYIGKIKKKVKLLNYINT